MKPLLTVLAVSLLAQGSGEGCQPMNCPYPAEDEGKAIWYTFYGEDPKNLDPAVSYYSNEYDVLAQIYEPPLEYHYLKRPYTLQPLTLTEMPRPQYFDAAGKPLPENPPAEQVARTVYECRLKPGIRFQEHPCFALKPDGSPRYVPLDPGLAKRVWSPEDFPEKATRELTADDYVFGFKRLANPLYDCPIRATLAKYVLGMSEYTAAQTKTLEDERARRKARAGAAYNQALDERANPIVLDPGAVPFPGVEAVDRYTFRYVLKSKYPQFLFWMAMPFLAPMPPEAEAFYGQAALVDRNIGLRDYPVGTGPFRMKRFDRNRRLILVRNPGFRQERYPSEGAPGDAEKGLLRDAGKPMPFLDGIVFSREKEPTSLWNKFLQGYFDASAIASDNFEQAVSITSGGTLDVSSELQDKGISLHQETRVSTYYTSFNFNDKLVGGVDEKRCKLRQAISIALDTEEFLQIFLNGRGIPAMSPLPPGIVGYEEGREAMDPFVYDWNEAAGRPQRKPIDEAKRLLAEAGYPNGIGPDGKQLVIDFDNAYTSSASQQLLNWIRGRFALLGIHLESKTTDPNRLHEKMVTGNFQMSDMGWNADYPDPENFYFLLSSQNFYPEGENKPRYSNPEFDALFRRMENMENGPERMALIRSMRALLQHDAAWIQSYHPLSFALFHAWIGNYKPNLIANNTMKYLKVDPERRAACRKAWNGPNWGVVGLAGLGALALILPAWWTIRRRERGAA